jgi:hypothetical protein
MGDCCLVTCDGDHEISVSQRGDFEYFCLVTCDEDHEISVLDRVTMKISVS